MSLIFYRAGALRIEVQYLQRRKNTWYFRRRIPHDVRKLYPADKDFLFFSLKTSDLTEATKRADRYARHQDALWMAHRGGGSDYGPEVHAAALAMLQAHQLQPGDYERHWKPQDIEPDSFINELTHLSDGEGEIIAENLPPYARLAANLFYGLEKPTPFLSEALKLFQRLKAEEEGTKEFDARQKAVTRFLEEAGDMPVDRYAREHARAYVDGLVGEGLKSATVRRYINYISPVFNLAIKEYELAKPNIFDGIIIPKLGEDAVKRPPFTTEELRRLQRCCLESDDELRWLLALISDTGMRLSEGVGLQRSDLMLDASVPHVTIQPNSARRLKTPSSRRSVPLVGASLWAGRRLAMSTSTGFLFPRYLSGGRIQATHASNALNKWLKSVGLDKTVHSLRHTMRDRLRNAGATEEIADRIGGWSTKGVGQAYGQGHSLEVLQGWMLKTVDAALWSKGEGHQDQ